MPLWRVVMTKFMPLLVWTLKYFLVTKVCSILCLRCLSLAYFKFFVVLIWHPGRRNQVAPRWNREAERSTGAELHIFTAGWVAGGEFSSEVSPRHSEKSECDILFLNEMIAILCGRVWPLQRQSYVKSYHTFYTLNYYQYSFTEKLRCLRKHSYRLFCKARLCKDLLPCNRITKPSALKLCMVASVIGRD